MPLLGYTVYRKKNSKVAGANSVVNDGGQLAAQLVCTWVTWMLDAQSAALETCPGS